MLVTRAVLFVAGAVVLAGAAALNVVLAYRTRPFVRAAASPRNEALDRWRASIDPVRGRVLVVATVVLAVLAGSVASGQWQNFMLWRNGGDWGPTTSTSTRTSGSTSSTTRGCASSRRSSSSPSR